ncbi:MAG: AGE family epimerase/isomerase [Caulobacteraceae bacterium]|nr:AGE family epimerase/isomerase [Caulobacteraceae bacterium]
MAIVPIILCGGPGSRLWPVSTPRRPKPFLDLFGERSLFQQTVLRVAEVEGAEPPVVVTGKAHAAEARRQLLELGVDATILTEPVGRDSAPALLAASLWIARRSDAITLAVASDHHIPDNAAFAESIAAATPRARAGAIVTFGVRPTHAATSFGYIRPGALLPGDPAVRSVEAFIEKPLPEAAAALVASGCLWNSGNFLFRPAVMIDEARAFAPALVEALEHAAPIEVSRDVFDLPADFASAERVSIDVAVMERTSRAAVLPIDYTWSDLGSWEAVWNVAQRDGDGNAVSGDAALSETQDSFIRAEEGARVIALGLRKIAVVARGKEVLVSDLGSASLLKAALPAAALEGVEDSIALTSVGQWSRRLEAWLTRRALPAWWCFGADHEGGGFHEALSPQFAPLDGPRRSRVQARQVFVYATAGKLGWQGPWRAAARHGLEALDDQFLRKDDLYRFAAPGSGNTAAEDSALLYEQAFVLLALAAVAEADVAIEPRSADRAARLAVTVRNAFAHRAGGFSADLGGTAFLSDPLMHLFEASLAWLRIGAGDLWRDLAAEIFDLFSSRLFDREGGRVYEAYDRDWRPLETTSDDRIEPGHQFEWAWLLSQWVALGGDIAAAGMAQRLYRTGKQGVSAASGLVVDALNDDLSVARASSRLWPQTEWLRAAATLEADPIARDREVCAAAAAIDRYLLPSGLWQDAPKDAVAEADHLASASSFYHIIGAIEALAVAARDEADLPAPSRSAPIWSRPFI